MKTFGQFVAESTLDDKIEYRNRKSAEDARSKSPAGQKSSATLTALKHAHNAKLRGDDERHSYWLKRAYATLTGEE